MATNINWQDLSEYAWKAREHAFILGKTKVGAAILSNTFNIYTGCNVENTYRNHDVHAEVNAITNMINQGEHKIIAIMIVAEREKFSPCGSCLDWIFQFGGKECLVGWQSKRSTDPKIFTAKELMPQYPY